MLEINCISGAIRLFGSLLYIPAIRYFSRRGLLCISSFLMGISLILLGLAVYSHHSKDSALRHRCSPIILKRWRHLEKSKDN